jgi:hypothetical protein
MVNQGYKQVGKSEELFLCIVPYSGAGSPESRQPGYSLRHQENNPKKSSRRFVLPMRAWQSLNLAKRNLVWNAQRMIG